MKGMVFTGEMWPFSPALGCWAAAFFSASRQRRISSLERRSRSAFSFAVWWRATDSSM